MGKSPLGWALACAICNLDVVCRVTEYLLHISVLRNVDARGTLMPGLPWPVNSQKLSNWADDIRMDPNNPEYSNITELTMVSFSNYQYYKHTLFPHMYLLHSFIICCAFFPEAWGACESRIGGTYDFQSEYWKDIRKK